MEPNELPLKERMKIPRQKMPEQDPRNELPISRKLTWAMMKKQPAWKPCAA